MIDEAFYPWFVAPVLAVGRGYIGEGLGWKNHGKRRED